MESSKKEALSREEYTERLDKVILKRTQGLALTRGEERIYAYRDVDRCKCGIRR